MSAIGKAAYDANSGNQYVKSHPFALPSPECYVLSSSARWRTQMQNESAIFVFCRMQREGPWENSEDMSTENETMKECRPCVEVQNPGQVPTRKCTKSSKRDEQQKCPQPHTYIGGVLPIAPTSTWATRIAGKRKNRSSVDNKACDTTKRNLVVSHALLSTDEHQTNQTKK